MNQINHEVQISSISDLAKARAHQLGLIGEQFKINKFYIRTIGKIAFIGNDRYPIYYGSITDANNSDDKVDIVIKKYLVQSSGITTGGIVEICGYLELHERNKVFTLRIQVTQILNTKISEEMRICHDMTLLDNLKQIEHKPVQFPIKTTIINMAVILPMSSNDSPSDFIPDISDTTYNSIINIITYKANVHSKDSIADEISKIKQAEYDVVAIIRGGGNFLDVFDNLELCKDFAGIKAHKIVAIGHAQNRSLIEYAADYAERTPADLRNYLIKNLDIMLELSKISNLNNNQELIKIQSDLELAVITKQNLISELESKQNMINSLQEKNYNAELKLTKQQNLERRLSQLESEINTSVKSLTEALTQVTDLTNKNSGLNKSMQTLKISLAVAAATTVISLLIIFTH
ncbi:MAG: hypothetical protein K2Y14_00155 [Burkholderiales bacterium]|nr:hypothetical protein [Burkholderiales bacterium]